MPAHSRVAVTTVLTVHRARASSTPSHSLNRSRISPITHQSAHPPSAYSLAHLPTHSLADSLTKVGGKQPPIQSRKALFTQSGAQAAYHALVGTRETNSQSRLYHLSRGLARWIKTHPHWSALTLCPNPNQCQSPIHLPTYSLTHILKSQCGSCEYDTGEVLGRDCLGIRIVRVREQNEGLTCVLCNPHGMCWCIHIWRCACH